MADMNFTNRVYGRRYELLAQLRELGKESEVFETWIALDSALKGTWGQENLERSGVKHVIERAYALVTELVQIELAEHRKESSDG